MREWAIAALVLAGCARHVPPSSPSPPVARGTSPETSSPPPDDELPSLDRVAASGAALAPGMRELVRLETTAGSSSEILTPSPRDVCLRVAFVASAPVAPELDDDRGLPFATAKRGRSGKIGDDGPVCVRRGSSVRLRFVADGSTNPSAEGGGAPRSGSSAREVRVRFVVWSP